MLEIPKQLFKQKIIPLKKSKNMEDMKKPREKGWTKTTNYTISEFKERFPNDERFGVMTGFNKLVVIDCDTKEFQDNCLKYEAFNKTFTVKTAISGLYHFYFYVDIENPSTHRIDQFTKDDKRRVCDFQGVGAQVVGPNSKLVDGKEYTIVNDCEIESVGYDVLLKTCEEMVPNCQVEEYNIKKRQDKTNTNPDIYETDPVIIYIKSKITIRDLLEEWGINTRTGRNCECPFHSSKSGQCLSYDDHQFHCFHCNRSGSMFDLAMEVYNEDFLTVKNRLAEKVGVPDKIKREAINLAIRAKKAELTEFMVSEFLKNNNVYTIRNSIKPEMWIYNNGIYIPHAETYITQYCRAMLNEYFSTHTINQVIAKIRADTYINEENFFSINYEFEIPVRNGILNIKTREITKFNPEKIFFNKLPIFYDESQKCPDIMSFLYSSLNGEDDIKIVQEACGYTLWKSNKYKKAFMLTGDGDNGKSVFLDLLSNALGSENCSNISLYDLDNEKFSSAGLFGKMINVNADIGQGVLEETSTFKKIVAGDEIEAQRKFLTPIKFRNYAKCFFALNKVPETNDKSDGFFTRWIIIDFPYTFKNVEDYYSMSEDKKQSGKYKIADNFILEKLTTDKEMSGFLNWILEGFTDIYKNKKFSINPIIDDIKRMWLRKESSLTAFFEDRIEITYNDDDFIMSTDLLFEYNQYCAKNNLKVLNRKKYKETLEMKPIKLKRKRFHSGSIKSEYRWIWSGLKLK